MKIGITHRLFLAILAATALAVVAIFLIMQWSIGRGFLRYVNTLEQMQLTRIADELEEDYGREGSWDFLRDNPGYWRRLVFSSLPAQECMMPGMEPPPPPPPPMHGQGGMGGRHHGNPMMAAGRHFPMRLLVLDENQAPLVGPDRPHEKIPLHPLRHEDRTIGYLGLLPLADLTEDHQLRFVKEQKLTLALVALVVALVAAGLALPLAGRLVRPIKALTAAARKMAAGEFATRVTVTSADELGQLAQDFNLLALTLEKNEKTRRQWVADISHELRTPLAVLRAEIEALQDGVRSVTTESIHSLHGEVLRLGRLVDDLYQLSLSDLGGLTYRKEEVDLVELVDAVLALNRPKFASKGIALDTNFGQGEEILVFGDPERLRQLLANLLDNSRKYTDPGDRPDGGSVAGARDGAGATDRPDGGSVAGARDGAGATDRQDGESVAGARDGVGATGRLIVTLSREDGKAVIDLQDSPPGVEESKLERLFERLYRVESSRSRGAGGAGLGLAICKNIVEAHAGTIEARPSPLGGVWIRIMLPLMENT